LPLTDDYVAIPANDAWYLWTTADGNKTETYLGVSVKLFGRTLTFDSTGKLVKVAPKTNSAMDGRYLHPWQCYLTSFQTVPDSCSVAINPNSTLMQTYSYRTSWKDSLWKDAWTHANITNFSNTFTLTAATHCVWMEVTFVAGDITAVAIKNGVPGVVTWNADLRYVSADNTLSSGGSFTWYQLLAYLKKSSDPGGSEKDIRLSGSWYKLMCPTTTHLMQGYFPGADFFGYPPEMHTGLVPWYGCVWFGS
jgi:hypothetical protein